MERLATLTCEPDHCSHRRNSAHLADRNPVARGPCGNAGPQVGYLDVALSTAAGQSWYRWATSWTFPTVFSVFYFLHIHQERRCNSVLWRHICMLMHVHTHSSETENVICKPHASFKRQTFPQTLPVAPPDSQYGDPWKKGLHQVYSCLKGSRATTHQPHL